MSKSKDPTYIAERLRRTAIRKKKRQDKRTYNIRRYGRQSEATCPDCGGTRVWCCDMWSKVCCHDYGTCPCS